MFSPVSAVGALIRAGAFYGTCFAVRRPDTFLTAKHCLPSQHDEVRIAIGSLTETAVLTVADVIPHERVDLAVIRTSGTRTYVPTEGYDEFAPDVTRAEREEACFVDDFPREQPLMGIGYESYGFSSDMPTQHHRGGVGEPRSFRGYVHRRMTFSGPYGTYRALELSEGVPGGASGSPLYVPEGRQVFGLATTTAESVMPGQRVHETEPGILQVSGNQAMTWRVGVALNLAFYRDWIDQATAELWRQS